METTQTCPYCNARIPDGSYFCLNCGKKVGNKPLSTSVSKQISVYIVSILLPPFGLWWAYKYFRQGDNTSRNIGIAIVILTIAALAINVWAASAFYGRYADVLNQLTGQGFLY